MNVMNMVDGFNRVPRKLRISVTDRCNMQCIYCMPQEDVTWFQKSEILSYEEIARLARIFAGLGIEKIRITGGEPLVRPELEKLVGALVRIREIKKFSMTTNGLLLGEKAGQLKRAGLHSVNVSLDTLVRERFKRITGVDGLDKVLGSLRAASEAGLGVKINTVVMRGWNDDEVEALAQFSRAYGYVVRFIEFMPLDGSHMWDPSLVVTKDEMMSTIVRRITDLVPLNNDASDPAKLYSFKDGSGTIGFIPSMSEPFCHSCDRIRITSDGKFLTCLFEPPVHDLKVLVRAGRPDEEIARYILDCYAKKTEGIISIIRSKNLRPRLNLMHTIGG